MRRDERGFTLPELLVVILIMGILFAIATVSWQNVIRDRQVTSASNQLLADMRLAHSGASNQLADYRIVYNSAGNQVTCGTATGSYCFVKLDSAGSPVQNTPRTLPDGTKILGTNVNLSSALAALFPGSDRALEFNADGSAEAVSGYVPSAQEPDPTVRVGSASDSSRLRRISVTLATSKVRNDA